MNYTSFLFYSIAGSIYSTLVLLQDGQEQLIFIGVGLLLLTAALRSFLGIEQYAREFHEKSAVFSEKQEYFYFGEHQVATKNDKEAWFLKEYERIRNSKLVLRGLALALVLFQIGSVVQNDNSSFSMAFLSILCFQFLLAFMSRYEHWLLYLGVTFLFTSIGFVGDLIGGWIYLGSLFFLMLGFCLHSF